MIVGGVFVFFELTGVLENDLKKVVLRIAIFGDGREAQCPSEASIRQSQGR